MTTTSAPARSFSSHLTILSTFFSSLSKSRVLHLLVRRHVHRGVAALVVREARDVELVAVADLGHLGDEAPLGGLVRLVLTRLLLGPAPLRDLQLVGGRDDDLLGHVADDLVEHHDDRHPVLLGEVEGLDREVEALLRGVRAERDEPVVAVRAEPGLHHVALRRLRREAGRRPRALHVEEDARRLGDGREADVLLHQREAGARRHGAGLEPAPDGALQRDGGRRARPRTGGSGPRRTGSAAPASRRPPWRG